MSKYSSEVYAVRSQYEQAQKLQAYIDELTKKLSDKNTEYVNMLEAQQLLASVSDANTNAILNYVMGIINKTLQELFPNDSRSITVKKTMYQGQYAHINIELTGSNGNTRDLTLQSGTGLRQVISFLFVVSLIEIRKGRRLLVMDEILSGLHPEAKRVILEIMDIFAEDGFQFAMVEYGVNDKGKIYNVENIKGTATIYPVDGKYNNEIYIFNREVENVDKSIHVEEISSDEI